jgi:hypothetical protein
VAIFGPAQCSGGDLPECERAGKAVSIGHDDTMLRDQFVEDFDRLSPV